MSHKLDVIGLMPFMRIVFSNLSVYSLKNIKYFSAYSLIINRISLTLIPFKYKKRF